MVRMTHDGKGNWNHEPLLRMVELQEGIKNDRMKDCWILKNGQVLLVMEWGMQILSADLQ